MKKAVAVLLTLAMAASLVACGGSSGAASSGGASSGGASGGSTAAAEPTDVGGTVGSTKAFPNAFEDGSIDLDKVSYFDREYDYTQNEKFKVAYIAADSGPLYQQAAESYEQWAKKMNCEWMGFTSTNGDDDLYLTTLENMINQGVNGFILDPNSTLFPAVDSLLAKYPEVSWMSQMSPPRDSAEGEGLPVGGNLIHPYVGFDNHDAGWQQAIKLDEWRQENIPDVPLDEIGFAVFDFSVSPPLHERAEAVHEYWKGVTGNPDMEFFYLDCVATGINLQGGMDAASPVISANSKYKNWLIVGVIDDWAQAAATIFDQQGLTDGSCTVSFGGAALRKQWDAGQYDAYRFALYTDNNLYCEPIIGAVYAMMNGWATADELWPKWINYNDCGADGHTYACPRLPTVWLLPDTYQHYLEWCDMYAGANLYDYPQDGINPDDYTPFVEEVPAEYAKK